MINNIYKKILFSLISLFALKSNFCFAAARARRISETSLSDIITILFVIFVFASVVLYFFVFLPYLKKKKTKEFCEKNHLSFTANADKLPDNIKYNFIKLGIGKYGKLKYKYQNIMHGERNGITFTICDFYIEFTNDYGSIGSRNFPLLIMKNYNSSFPSFVLSNGSSLNKYKSISYMTGSKNTSSTFQSDYSNSILLYSGERILFDQDERFNNAFVLQADNKEQTELFFNDGIRNIFKPKANSDYIYEGNGNYFIVSKTSETSFEETIKFFEENLKLFTELVS